MSPDSSTIDAALVTKLWNDATLAGLCPDGVYLDEAPQNTTRFVIVSLVEEADEPKFGGRSYEDALYSVEARMLSTAAGLGDIEAAAARIDALLDDQVLGGGSPNPTPGYTWMAMHRESRLPVFTEVDDVDMAIRWYRGGGMYRVMMSVNP